MMPHDEEIHIWDVDLDAGTADPGVLSPDECERADKFMFDLHRARFVAGRVAMRRILAGYTGVGAAAIEFRYNRFGKPDLKQATGIRFNASHSIGRQLVAVTCAREIGIDLEHIRPGVPFDAIAQRFLPPAEAALARTADDFFRAWTRREAFLKAAGWGLSGVREHVPPGWTIEDIDAGEGWVAALAVEGAACRIVRRVFTW